MANKYFRWYDLRLAKSITMTGQVMIRFIANRLNEFLNKELNTNIDYCTCSDTDSTYICFDKIYKKLNMQAIDDLDTYIKNVIEPYISEQFKIIYEYMNHFDFQIMMKRECIANKALFLNSKKRYVLNVIDNEGVRYTEPKLKIMGLEVIKSSTPEGIKKYLLEVIKVILSNNKSEVINYIDFMRAKYKELSPEEIAISMSVSYLNKYPSIDSKGVPINSRATMNYNNYLKKCGLDKKYQYIKEGSKIKFVFLNSLNPTGQNVIAFENFLPKEFNLEEYIDYDLMFEKTVIKNIRNITDDFNWNLNVKYTIDDLL